LVQKELEGSTPPASVSCPARHARLVEEQMRKKKKGPEKAIDGDHGGLEVLKLNKN
jgi:hypothetical protein